MAAIVEQCIDRLLKHALLVADDHIRRFELKQVLQPIVAVDDPAVEIVQIRGRKTAAFERNERTQIGWDDREDVEDHPIRPGM